MKAAVDENLPILLVIHLALHNVSAFSYVFSVLNVNNDVLIYKMTPLVDGTLPCL